MKFGLRSLAVVGGLLVGLALPATANAWYSTTEGAVTLRTGPGINYKRIATIPAGASIWVNWCKQRWCSAVWHGLRGFVAASYVAGPHAKPMPYNYYDDYYWLYFHDYPHHRPHKPPHKPPHCDGPGDCKPPKWDGNWKKSGEQSQPPQGGGVVTSAGAKFSGGDGPQGSGPSPGYRDNEDRRGPPGGYRKWEDE